MVNALGVIYFSIIYKIFILVSQNEGEVFLEHH